MNTREPHVQAILDLTPAERYSFFIKQVVERDEIWALYDDGWATSEDAHGNTILPLWPAKEFAEPCIAGHWATFKAKAIPMSAVLDDMIPSLRAAGMLPGVFYIATEGSVDVSFDELESDLRAALTHDG